MDQISVEEHTGDLGVQPLGPGHADQDRLLWLEFAAVEIRRDVNALVLGLGEVRRGLDSVKGRVTLMGGIMIGIMSVLKMLPDHSLDLIRHFLAG